jgi:hypothetical protein
MAERAAARKEREAEEESRANRKLAEGDEKRAREEAAKAREDEAKEIERFEKEKARLERSIARERRLLEADIAKERDRLDRELHRKRMDDLRKEIAEQSKSAAGLSTVAASAQSEFDRAFAMFRDPSRAAAEIGEEKDYQRDLDRLHKTARQYGGKWRIDELSRLMAAGDTQGVADTLNTWRKTKGFTPEVEAMVRASAAENAKTTVEDELRKIETNTADLATKLDELLQLKGGG